MDFDRSVSVLSSLAVVSNELESSFYVDVPFSLQEAFRSAKDTYGLMCMVNKTPKSSLLVVYYSILTEIFWNSSSHLHHAYAWLNLFSLQKNFNKNLNQKDLQLIASSVVLAALSILPFDRSHGASHLELENEKERSLRMSNLIGFNLEPKFEGRDMVNIKLVCFCTIILYHCFWLTFSNSIHSISSFVGYHFCQSW